VVGLQDLSDRTRFERVVRAIDPRAVLRRTWSLRGGISSRMTVLEFALGTETRRVVLRRPDGALRENPLAAANEFKLLGRLEAAGLPAPTACLLDRSGKVFPAPYLVIGYIDGAPDLVTIPSTGLVAQLVSNLVKIHRVEAARFEQLPVYTPCFLRQQHSTYPDASLDAARIRDVLRRSWAPRSSNPTVLLHGDYWPGNILWKDGRLVGVVDWEEACLGDPMCDVAIARLDLLWAFGIATMDEFTRQYRSVSGFDLGDLPYWDLDAALRPVFNIGEWAAGSAALQGPNVTEETMRAGHRTFVEQAFDALSRGHR
jgi:aminoglycoside phosphotransferase (APT) family kinase protein